VAVVCGSRWLTYRELGGRVAQLAHAVHAVGGRPEAVVAVGVSRSAEMVICVLAAMAAGAAFVPVDPGWPRHRRKQVLADSGAAAAFIGAGDESDWGVTTLVVDTDDWGYSGMPAQPPALTVEPEQLAYVIFTSGSTGKPKGAMIRHDAIAERLLWQRDHILHFGAEDAALFKAPLSFDISVNEILLPLISGGRVVVAEPGGDKDPQYLLDLIRTHRVTFVYLVSSMLDTLLELGGAGTAGAAPSALASLRHVWCGGEVLTPGLFARFRRQLATTLYHGYGPAEATIGVSHVIYRDTAERIATSIGRPNPHTQLYVLDDDLRPAPPGASGELYAAGFLLGRGYVNAASLTASRFVANPFDANGSRMYRTGDLARWTAEGSLEFLGRADNQVKIRGRRIELEEIETQLADHPAVRRAVVDVATAPGGSNSRRSRPSSPTTPRCAGPSSTLPPHPAAPTTSSAMWSPTASLTVSLKPAATPWRTPSCIASSPTGAGPGCPNTWCRRCSSHWTRCR
jgi:amino acid adenylation domain-containing protein